MKQFGSTDGGSSHSTLGVNILLQSPVSIVIIMLISLCNERDTAHTRGIDFLKITDTSLVWFLVAIMAGQTGVILCPNNDSKYHGSDSPLKCSVFNVMEQLQV